MNQFKGKVAVVTGGSRGIGKAIAVALAREGCDLAITSRTQKDLDAAQPALSRFEVKVRSIRADVRNSKDVDRLAKEVEQNLGPAHILINNAGIGLFSEVTRMSDEDFRAVLETNLFGPFYCARAFIPQMIRNKEGYIINISSLAGKNNFASGSAYCASKHALNSFAECLMLEVRHQNIKVSTICPGSVQTDFSQSSRDKSWALAGDDVADAVLGVLRGSAGSLMSLIDLRPLKPQK